MSIRIKLALVLAACMTGATAAAAAFLLQLQGRSLEKEQGARFDLVAAVAESAAREAAGSGDILPFLDAVAGLRAEHPDIASARLRLAGGPWREVGTSLPAAAPLSRWVSAPGAGGLAAAEAELVFDQKTAQAQRRREYARLLGDAGQAVGAAALLGAVAAFLISGGLTRRLLLIEKAVAGLAEGRAEPPEALAGSDEIARLSQGVREAARRLSELDEAKRTFVASVTHELRAPLAAMRHHLKDIRAEGAHSQEAVKKLDSFERNLSRLETFVTSLLETAKVARGTLEVRARPSLLGPILTDAAEFFSAQARAAGLELVSEVPEGLPQARFDPDLVAQVAANLLSNAVKYTPRGGHIRLRAGAVDAGRALEFSVIDDGPGIAPEAQERLFRPFERVKGSRAPGAGLGLALARRVAELHGGSLTLQSAPGKGAVFTVRLPAAGPQGKAINAS